MWCELGLIFHNMTLVAEHCKKQVDGSKTVASASNFHTVFHHSSAAAAVGLLKDTLSGPRSNAQTDVKTPVGLDAASATSQVSTSAIPQIQESYGLRLQQVLQTFARYFLSQLSRESEQESRVSNAGRTGKIPSADDVIDSTFGITVNSTTTFQISGSVDSAVHKVFQLDLSCSPAAPLGVSAAKSAQAVKDDATMLASFLKPSNSVYPCTVSVRSKWTAGNAPSQPSFCAVLWRTLNRETYMKGWCSASEAYEPFRQVKSAVVSSLPPILTLVCGETLPSAAPAPLSPTASPASPLGDTVNKEKAAIAELWHSHSSGNSSPWMPSECEVFRVPISAMPGYSADAKGPADVMFVSERLHRTKTVSRGVGAAPSPSKPELKRATSGTSDAASSGGWLIFNGSCYISSPCPASVLIRDAIDRQTDGAAARLDPVGEDVMLDLYAVVSHVDSGSASAGRRSAADEATSHAILHINRGIFQCDDAEVARDSSWVLLNDFTVSPSDELDVCSFADWRHPSVLFFARRGSSASSQLIQATPPPVIPESVLSLPSLSSVPSVRPVAVAFLPKGDYLTRLSSDHEPKGPPLIAFDAEFVTVETEDIHLDTHGQQVIGREGRQVVARISLLAEAPVVTSKMRNDPSIGGRLKGNGWRGEIKIPEVRLAAGSMNSGLAGPESEIEKGSKLSGQQSVPLCLLSDDYVLPSEPVVDYVTRFSGLTSDDLTPAISTHSVIPHRSAVLKLRYYIDAGCIFVGHGLNKDFETANLFVPPEQVCNFVSIYFLNR
jgi:hypothetical protein